MCRGFQQKHRELLKIKAFYVHLSFSCSQPKGFHDSLTLHFLPRINGGHLEINGFDVRPDKSGFVTLHQVVSEDTLSRRATMYGTRERLGVSEGLRFDIYASDVKVLKGVFRKAEGENWKIDCKCEVESDRGGAEFLSEAELWVESEGRQVGMMTEKVEIAEMSRSSRRMNRSGRCLERLEEIPEQREEEDCEWDGCCCCCECDGKAMEAEGGDFEMDADAGASVGFAVDVGFWVMCCVGVGYYLASKASRARIIIARQNTRFF